MNTNSWYVPGFNALQVNLFEGFIRQHGIAISCKRGRSEEEVWPKSDNQQRRRARDRNELLWSQHFLYRL